MLKRLSYPLVWMGESLTADSKENSPVLPADKDPNAESVFSKVFSRLGVAYLILWNFIHLAQKSYVNSNKWRRER